MSTRVIHLGCTIDTAIMKASLPIGKCKCTKYDRLLEYSGVTMSSSNYI